MKLVVTYIRPEQLPGLVEMMLGRGYTAEQVKGILGENYLRVARQVWK